MQNIVQTRLKELVSNSPLNLREISELCDIKYRTFQDYLAGKSMPGGENIFKIATFFCVSSDYLLGIDEPTASMVCEEKTYYNRQIPPPGGNIYKAPIINRWPYKEGEEVSYMYLPEDEELQGALVFIAADNSRNPPISVADMVFFRTDAQPESGSYVAVTDRHGALFARRYVKTKEGAELLYDAMGRSMELTEECIFKVVGKIVDCRRKVVLD
jgi:hypothetical protein